MTALALAQIAIGRQSALEPGGPAARDIGTLWNVMLVVGVVVTVLVFAVFAWALFRRRSPEFVPEADRPADPRGELYNDESGGRGREDIGRPRSEILGTRAMVLAGVAAPAVILLGLQIYTLVVLNRVALPSHTRASFDQAPAANEIVVRVTGRQYWWEVEYLAADPRDRFETANELRIPVGRRVILELVSDDVIHSFWVPGLQGKMDLIPGRLNAMWIEASSPGVWRGQCAEYCGVQHALMAFVVVAQPVEEWEQWRTAQRRPAATPGDSVALADRNAFVTSGCALCHTVRGTPAGGDLGPDLTHMASRLTLAAGTLPNTPGHRYGWIADPQAIKPGSKMPSVPMTPELLHAIGRYLGSLR